MVKKEGKNSWKEDELHNFKIKYHNIIENAIVGIVITRNRKVIFCNKKESELFGYKNPSELHGCDISDFVHKDDLPKLIKISKKIKLGNAMSSPAIFRGIRRDGRELVIKAFAMRSLSNDKEDVLSFHIDITEKKKAEDALKKSEKRFRLLFENLQDGIVVINNKGQFLLANEAAARNLGYTIEEFLKLNITDIEAKESKKEFEKHYSDMLNGKRLRFETVHRKKDGSLMDVDVSLNVTELDGKKVSYSIWRDVTEKKKAEEEIKKSKRTIQILNNVSEQLHRSLDKNRIYNMIAGELKKVGFNTTFLMLDKKTKKLHVEYSSYTSDMGSMLIKMLKFTKADVKNISFPVTIFKDFKKIFEEKKPIYFDNHQFDRAVKSIFPDISNDARMKLLKKLGNPKFTVVSPLKIKNKVIGTMGITSDNLNNKDIPAIEAFANQVSIALENAELYKQAKERMLLTQKQNIQLIKLQNRLKSYAKRLEIKVRKLEKDKIRLTDKEKLVLWGITRYPYDNDLKLSDKLKIKRSTITAIRNRLRKEDRYSVANIPNFKALGAELITFAYGKFDIPFEKRQDIIKNEEFDIKTNYLVHTDNEFIRGFISKNMAEFEKSAEKGVQIEKKHNIVKKYENVHFLFELNKIYKFFDYSNVLKSLFKIKINDRNAGEKFGEEVKRLSKNEKKVLLAMVEYPKLSAYDLSFKVDLTRTTVAKIKKRLIKQRLVRTAVVPNIEKLGIGLLMLTHTKHGLGFNEKATKSMLSGNSHIVFLIGGNKEAIALSLFKDYNEYREFKKKMPIHKKNIFLEEPVMFKLLTKNIKTRRFNFLDITKKLLEEN